VHRPQFITSNKPNSQYYAAITDQKLIKRTGITTGKKHNISVNNSMTASQNTIIYYTDLNQIITTAETSRNKLNRLHILS